MMNNLMSRRLLDGKRIFVVEDNNENRVIFKMIFARHGAIVDFDRWGRDTLFRLKGLNEIDLIILDLMLAQNVSGFDIQEEIRTFPRYQNVPIIAVSAMDPAIAIPKAQARGFDGFIVKPIDNELFPRQIVSILNGNPVWYAG